MVFQADVSLPWPFCFKHEKTLGAAFIGCLRALHLSFYTVKLFAGFAVYSESVHSKLKMDTVDEEFICLIVAILPSLLTLCQLWKLRIFANNIIDLLFHYANIGNL